MRPRTKHEPKELIIRASLALKNVTLIEIVEVHRFPSGAQKAASFLGFKDEAYSVWALARLKKDCLEIYSNLKEVKECQKNA